jgi:hypothetical protein
VIVFFLQRVYCVENMLTSLCQTVFEWVAEASFIDEKRTDVVCIRNFAFLHTSLSEINIGYLSEFTSTALREWSVAEIRYVDWMISYEFPFVSTVSKRMEEINDRVSDDELTLYIRRYAVLFRPPNTFIGDY